jgi:hypothetical protein
MLKILDFCFDEGCFGLLVRETIAFLLRPECI